MMTTINLLQALRNMDTRFAINQLMEDKNISFESALFLVEVFTK